MQASHEEVQAAHQRIFRAMDANKDGRLTLDDMQAFSSRDLNSSNFVFVKAIR